MKEFHNLGEFLPRSLGELHLLDLFTEVRHSEVIVRPGISLTAKAFCELEKLSSSQNWFDSLPVQLEKLGVRSIRLKEEVHLRNAESCLDLLIDLENASLRLGFRDQNDSALSLNRCHKLL